jgi:tRNA(Ile2) C34 agmatinyltransferase TiaS
MPKKCPTCNSTRLIKGKGGMKCLKCGYENRKWDNVQDVRKQEDY